MLPALAQRKLRTGLFFEVKANLGRADVALLRDAGVTFIQPGIESLDSGVLRLMRKGVTLLQNVQLLKLCAEFDVRVTWNLIYGFPSEDPAAYAGIARLVPLLTHLTPPASVARLRLDRFSPLFDDPDAFGLTAIRPAPAYAFVHRAAESELRALAYYFEFDYVDGRMLDTYARAAVDAIEVWRDGAATAEFVALDIGGALLLIDRRPIARSPAMVLAGVQRAVCRACMDICSLARLKAELGIAEDVLLPILTDFVAAGVMIAEGSQYLSLALSPTGRGLSPTMREQLSAVARALASIRSTGPARFAADDAL